jgi:phenylalanine-4-hydroxylase
MDSTTNGLLPPAGFDYGARRQAIADLGLETVNYLPHENEIWHVVMDALEPLHESLACSEYRSGYESLDLPGSSVAQLGAVNARLQTLTGFRLTPTAGIAAPQAFYSVLADRRFTAARFVRDATDPFFSPDPDVLHEVIGHGASLASGPIAELYEAAGAAFRRLADNNSIEVFSRVFWFVFETGTLYEGGRVKAFGASVLSSVSELRQLEQVAVTRVGNSLFELAEAPYDIRRFQPVVFAFDSFEHLQELLLAFFERCGTGVPLGKGL